MSSDELIGVIWSPDIHYDGVAGYALVITSNRIVGTRKSAMFHAFEMYVGPRLKHLPSNADRAKAQEVATDLIASKEFELTNDSIVKILYKKPGFYTHGHVIFQTAAQQIQVEISFYQGGVNVSKTVGILVASLNVFAPDRFYDEETGALVRDELIKKVEEEQQKKHWW